MSPAPNKVELKKAAEKKPSAIPAGVKRPNDHKPAKADVTDPQDHVVEWHGNKYVVLAAAQDDAELLEYLTDQNHVGALMCMIGREGWAEYKRHERDPKTGRVGNDGAAEFLAHILEELQAKNS